MNPWLLLAIKVGGPAAAYVGNMLVERWFGRTTKVKSNSLWDYLFSELPDKIIEAINQPKKQESKTMDSPSPAAQPLVDLLNLICDGANLGLKIVADKGVSISDGAALLSMLPDVKPAIAAIGGVGGALASLSPADAAAVEAGVMAKLNVSSDHAKAVIGAALDLLVKVDAFVQAFKSGAVVAPVAPVAPTPAVPPANPAP